MVMEEDLTLGGGHTEQHTRHVSQKCAFETYVISLIYETQINLIKATKRNEEKEAK